MENDNKYPNRICPGCHIQLEATKLFMDLIVKGQSQLREMYQKQETLILQEKHRQQLQEALQSVNPKSSVQSYTIQSNEAGFIQSFIESKRPRIVLKECSELFTIGMFILPIKNLYNFNV